MNMSSEKGLRSPVVIVAILMLGFSWAPIDIQNNGQCLLEFGHNDFTENPYLDRFASLSAI